MHGPNGVGKTVLLELVQGLFNYDYKNVVEIPFDELRIEFEGARYVKVWKEGHESLFVQLEGNSDIEPSVFAISLVNDKIEDLLDLTNEQIPNFNVFLMLSSTRGSPSLTPYWVDQDTLYTRLDLLRKYPHFHTRVYGELPDWFVTIQKEVDPKLIPTGRLIGGIAQSEISTVRLFAELQKKGVDLPWNRSQVFPGPSDAVGAIHNEVRSRAPGFFYNFEKVEDLKRDITALEDALHLDGVNESDFVANLLVEHLEFASEDLEEILVDPEFRVVHLFTDILNTNLLFKSMIVDSKEGLTIAADDGSKVPLSVLSSGEQHLLILYFHLLFEIEPDTLVMIDEPELSMNVVWQRNFLKDLQRIIELRKFDVLIATHSPQIIHDKWDWTVALGEKMDD